MKWLTAIPVYNEARHVRGVLAEVRRFSPCILVIDDGSTDDTATILANESGIHVIRHEVNRGYGAALQTAFEFGINRGYDVLVTMDCDGQHQPCRITTLLDAMKDTDIVSGSRYLQAFGDDTTAPGDRRFINATITEELNERFGLHLTDAFCGFKSYRCAVLAAMSIREPGYGMPLELWVQAAKLHLRIREIAVPRVYLDATRAFGGAMNDPVERLAYYRRVIEAAAS